MNTDDRQKASLAPICARRRQVTGIWPPPEIILEHVAITYGLSRQHLQSKRRDLLTVEAKRVAIHLLAASGLGASAIGRQMHLDHSTVLHHLRHALLDRWQQQLIGELETELHRMASRVPTPQCGHTLAPGRSSGVPRTTAMTCPPRPIPTLGKQSDRLQIISMPC